MPIVHMVYLALPRIGARAMPPNATIVAHNTALLLLSRAALLRPGIAKCATSTLTIGKTGRGLARHGQLGKAWPAWQGMAIAGAYIGHQGAARVLGLYL